MAGKGAHRYAVQTQGEKGSQATEEMEMTSGVRDLVEYWSRRNMAPVSLPAKPACK